jgi:FMN phosphatase YigB (HAD superfamily)
VRIALDIDSTLHPYWDQFAAAAKRRFGVELPYHEQLWAIDRLRPEQVRACVAETHKPEHILVAEPYPGAVEVVSAWHEAGNTVHVMSHRTPGAHDATAEWLERIGLAYDELYCLEDKVAHAQEIGIELLVDDSPVNLLAAVEAGIRTATLVHPWNRDICEEEDIVCATDWPELGRKLAPLLEGSRA